MIKVGMACAEMVHGVIPSSSGNSLIRSYLLHESALMGLKNLYDPDSVDKGPDTSDLLAKQKREKRENFCCKGLTAIIPTDL